MSAIADVSARSVNELISLKGRSAVVTGAARGLGKAIASRLAEAGANVVIGDILHAEAEAAAEDLDARYDSSIIGSHLDVTDSKSIATVAQRAVDEFGRLDIWVNNAGVFPSIPLAEWTEESWDQVFRVNTRGVLLGSQAASQQMIAGGAGGVIVNIASTAAFKGVAPGLAAYVGSKHAVRGITKQNALELAPHGIRVLGVAPTFCVTEGNMLAMQDNPPPADQDVDIAAMLGSTLGRVGVPDDIARVVLFCASDLAMFMTGSTLLADAGETI